MYNIYEIQITHHSKEHGNVITQTEVFVLYDFEEAIDVARHIAEGIRRSEKFADITSIREVYRGVGISLLKQTKDTVKVVKVYQPSI